MPKRVLERDLESFAIDVEDETAIEELAKKYKVSLQAFAWRINRLFGAG